MPERVLFEVENEQTRGDIAATLRDVADKLDGGEDLTLAAGDQSITLAVAERPTFEIKAERETEHGADEGELSVEFELEWDEGEDGDDGPVRIE